MYSLRLVITTNKYIPAETLEGALGVLEEYIVTSRELSTHPSYSKPVHTQVVTAEP